MQTSRSSTWTGWICSRLTAVTVDAHRRRRGQRGALQRPRLPCWLAGELGENRWLTTLAREILIWVGVPATAGSSLWPLDAWAEQRATVTGDWRGSDPATVAREVEHVLAAMRRRPVWHASYVEKPLGYKQAPAIPAQRTDPDRFAEPTPVQIVSRDEADDTRLRTLADLAVEAIAMRIGRGEEPESVVVNVVRTVFGPDTCSAELDRAPGIGSDEHAAVAVLLSDPPVVARLVADVLRIVAEV